MMQREKITERENLSYDEKMSIAQKSNERCCHCGKKVYFGFGATVEHVVPLTKGGVNRDINLVMLCEDCNQKKGMKIIPPADYLPYLNEEHMRKLKGYFDSYIHSFEYISRQNLLSCDQYLVRMAPAIKGGHIKKKGRKAYETMPTKKFWMIRAESEAELEKVSDYYIRYLKKYDLLDSEEAARKNIEFWHRFGCIYYVEKNNEIKTMFAITVRSLQENLRYRNTEKAVQIYMFPYYFNNETLTLTDGIRSKIVYQIIDEQGVPYLPLILTMARDDRASFFHLANRGAYKVYYEHAGFVSAYLLAGSSPEEREYNDEDEKATNQFFQSLGDVETKAASWCQKPENQCVNWMLSLLQEEQEAI